MSYCRCIATIVLVRLRFLFIIILCVILRHFGWLGYFYSLGGRHTIIPFILVRQCSSIKFRWILRVETINRTIRIGVRLIRLRIYNYTAWRYAGYTGNRPHHRLVIRLRRSEILTRYLGVTAGHGRHRGWRRRRRYRGIATLTL